MTFGLEEEINERHGNTLEVMTKFLREKMG